MLPCDHITQISLKHIHITTADYANYLTLKVHIYFSESEMKRISLCLFPSRALLPPLALTVPYFNAAPPCLHKILLIFVTLWIFSWNRFIQISASSKRQWGKKGGLGRDQGQDCIPKLSVEITTMLDRSQQKIINRKVAQCLFAIIWTKRWSLRSPSHLVSSTATSKDHLLWPDIYKINTHYRSATNFSSIPPPAASF